MVSKKTVGAILALALAQTLGGCAGQDADWKLADLTSQGQFGEARNYIRPRVIIAGKPAAGVTKDNPDRAYALDRMRLGLVTLADGYAAAGQGPWQDLYTILRQSGVNKDKKLVAAAINEDLKVWKGEPFEQALAFHYIGLNFAMQGSWDNARAAFENSLFPLNAIGKDHLSTAQLVTASLDVDEKGQKKTPTTDIDAMPEAAKTNFTLGYLMRGVAAKQMQVVTGDESRGDEARTNFHEVTALAPNLQQLTATLDQTGTYNTLLVVDYGQGPQKIGTGEDFAIASFKEHLASDARDLQVEVGSSASPLPFHQVCDVNLMAQDYMWNSLEEMRMAKSKIGSALVAAGAATLAGGAAAGGDAGNYMMLAGAGMMLIGAAEKAGAHADTRYCELLPQRIYVVPVNITAPNTPVTLQVDGVDSSRMVLLMDPPTGRAANLRYIRLIYPTTKFSSNGVLVKENPAPINLHPPGWATATTPVYASDVSPNTAKTNLPFILGGYSVRTPTAESLASYQQAGFLTNFTLDDLKYLYKAEGIACSLSDEQGAPGLHVLEGGKSLACPEKGTVGFTRLFCSEHPPYVPTSKVVQDLRAQINSPSHDVVAVKP